MNYDCALWEKSLTTVNILYANHSPHIITKIKVQTSFFHLYPAKNASITSRLMRTWLPMVRAFSSPLSMSACTSAAETLR